MIFNLNSYRIQILSRHREDSLKYIQYKRTTISRTNLSLRNYPVSNLMFFSATILLSGLVTPNIISCPEYFITNIYGNVFFLFQLTVPMLKV